MGGQRSIRSRAPRTWGESESAPRRAARTTDLRVDDTGAATLAFLASGIEGLKVRITASAPTVEEADAVIAAEEAEVRVVLGELVFGADDDTMESVVGSLLKERGLMLAVAESLTGGLVQERLAEVPGASDWFAGGVVAYDSAVKRKLLGVPDGPVVSEAAAEQMARGVRELLGADVGLSTTGVAGPTGQEGQPPGTVWLGMAVGDDVSAVLVMLPGGRQQVRQLSAISVLDWLRRKLLHSPPA